MSRTLRPGEGVLAAVSGGADSVAMLHQLRTAPYRLVVGHVDHRLRADSKRSADFVRRLCTEWDLPCRVARVDVKGRAARQRESVEEAARHLRYAALGRMALATRCRAIVTAHTMNDQAETVLMNLFRGAGPAGLAGMRPARRLSARSRVWLLRPLLKVERTTLRNYLRRHRLGWIDDPSNQDTAFTRNFVRLELLPRIEKRYPGVVARLSRMTVHMGGAFRLS